MSNTNQTINAKAKKEIQLLKDEVKRNMRYGNHCLARRCLERIKHLKEVRV